MDRKWILVVLFLVTLPSSHTFGEDGEDGEGSPASRETVTAALEDLRAKYGTSATAFQGYLLNFAIQGGSVLDTKVAIAGIEPRRDLRYLAFTLDSGIVYDETKSQQHQLARIWTDIVEPSARKAAEMSFPADGIALRITYRRGHYNDRADLQRQLRAQRVAAVEVACFIAGRDAADLFAARITPRDFAARTEVQVDGRPAEVDLNALSDAHD